MSISIAQKAPDFSLFDSEKNAIKLSDFNKEKNVLLLFFPLAFTSTCTKQLCTVRDDIATYANANAQVLGISIDSVYALAKFKEEQAYNFPLLSDFNKEVSATYGCIYDSFTHMQMKGVSKRSAFIIDKEGIVQYVEVLENASEVPNFSAINQLLETLR
jgi:glutaredoxin-dependent peroxiredoxin